MSVPNSLTIGPFTSIVLVKKRYLIFYIFLIWISVIPLLYELWIYYHFLWDDLRPIHFIIYLPFLCVGMYVTMVFTSFVASKILLTIVNKVHKPREGAFLRDRSDKDYRYWCLRNVIKRWPTWLAHKFPLPFLDNICFKLFGVKTKYSNSLFEGWVDTEFIQFGGNVVIGQASQIKSSVIVGNLLIIKKVIIGSNIRIGARCIIMPGTQIGDKCILTANSTTSGNQVLEAGWIYGGMPAKKIKRNYFFEEGLEKILQ